MGRIHGNRFELGFFTPENNVENNIYVGIWYYQLSPRTIVWVANRENPILSDSHGVVFGIGHGGNLEIWLANGTSVFSIPSSDNFGSSNTTMRLSDYGNLVLSDGRPGKSLWQSFDYPTNTFLPHMIMDKRIELISWITPSNPAPGDYRFIQDQLGVYKILNRSNTHWISGESNDFFKILNDKEMPSFVTQLLLYSQENKSYKANISYIPKMPYRYIDERILIDSTGEIQYQRWNNVSKVWDLFWSEPKDACSIIQGCDREDTTCQTKRDDFINLTLVKSGSPDLAFEPAQSENECKEECFNNCECKAYSYIGFNVTDIETGKQPPKCWIWTSDLYNLQEDLDHYQTSFNLSVRVPFLPKAQVNSGQYARGSKLNKSRKKTIYEIAFIVSVVGFILVFCSSYILYRRWTTKRNGNQGITEQFPVPLSYENQMRIEDFMNQNDKGTDIPFYNLDTILSATNNFSDANKLGQGGFGPVYKGKLPGGKRNCSEEVIKLLISSGYMSPEYAMEGKFSIKSDVFSFGVVVLEIISGKKNTGFYQPQEDLNLLGYAWRLWCENKALDLVDPILVQQSWEKSQVLKCINVGLLCVQEDPNDRPTMSNVVMMLGSEVTTLLPRPMRPAFVTRKRDCSSVPSTSSTKPDTISENEVTISMVQGR
ncbi:hypothetical protein RD792_007456 [Penstemon davidsonii]|uniref:Non-specific serine/threonine protein kinase n=1 Tax=Penstemon davidsonii TaxID=160366 RepID=A0ABR0D7U1_9LAMI|nr:hypothetical protein RD792_007456 [Penstemon davidsonii]